MPRASKKKEQYIQKKNEVINKKRKRADEDIDNKASSKKIKIGWLRDIKAVLRSAGNRLTHVENDSNCTRAGWKKSKRNKRRGTEFINSEEVKDEVEVDVIENMDVPRRFELDSEENLVVNNAEEAIDMCRRESRERLINPTQRKLDIVNENNESYIYNNPEVSCTFQQLQLKASGTMIRLENIEPMSASINVNNTNVSRINLNHMNSTRRDFDCENKMRMEVENLIDNIETHNKIEREDEYYDLPTQSSIIEGVMQTTNNDQQASNTTNKTDPRCPDNFQNRSYVFGIDNTINNNNSKAGFIFASNQNDHLILNRTNDPDEDNDFQTVQSHESNSSDSDHYVTELCMSPYQSERSNRNGYFTNGSIDYQIPINDNNDAVRAKDSAATTQDRTKYPVTQAYYDSNKGAYVDPLTLADNKVHNSLNSIRNTWGSIKNLISRVSGNKGNGDVQGNEGDEIVAQTEEDLNS